MSQSSFVYSWRVDQYYLKRNPKNLAWITRIWELNFILNKHSEFSLCFIRATNLFFFLHTGHGNLCPLPHFGTPFWFISVFESTSYLKFAKLQFVSSGFCCRVITGSLMSFIRGNYPTISCWSLLLGTPNNQLLFITTWYFQQSVDHYSNNLIITAWYFQQSVADHYYLVLPTISCLLFGTPTISCWLLGNTINQLLIITIWYSQQSVADNYYVALPTISYWSLLLRTPNNQKLIITWYSQQSVTGYYY